MRLQADLLPQRNFFLITFFHFFVRESSLSGTLQVFSLFSPLIVHFNFQNVVIFLKNYYSDQNNLRIHVDSQS